MVRWRLGTPGSANYWRILAPLLLRFYGFMSQIRHDQRRDVCPWLSLSQPQNSEKLLQGNGGVSWRLQGSNAATSWGMAHPCFDVNRNICWHCGCRCNFVDIHRHHSNPDPSHKSSGPSSAKQPCTTNLHIHVRAWTILYHLFQHANDTHPRYGYP